jgi:hypothetical protein
MSNESWYSAQCIFLHSDKGHGPKQMYEERIVLLRADSTEDAIEQAEKEAEEYCDDLEGCRYVGYVNVFAMFDKPGAGTEVFSTMQKSDLESKEYLNLHYPNEPDNCDAIGEIHRWYNLDEKHSACYHCKVVQEGQLWK